MAFSFNPGQATPQGASPAAAPFAANAAMPGTTLAGGPSIPDSPFLFMQNREEPITVNGYLQLLLALVAVLFVVFSVILAAYSFYLNYSVESKKETLANAEVTFPDYPIETMKRLSDRSSNLKILLQNYLSVRTPLKLLEDVVEKQVFFDEFNLSKDKKGGTYNASFVAVTNNYPVLVQQLSALNLSQYSKIAPKTKLDKVYVGKDTSLRVRVTTTIAAQGQLASDVVFTQSSQPQAAGSEATTTVEVE